MNNEKDMTMVSLDFFTEHLQTDEQRTLAHAILGLLPDGATGGGCKAFYTPDEWKKRKEDYGTDSVLVIVHDGGAISSLMNTDESLELLNQTLMEIGYYVELCTCWYSAVYSTDNN